MEAEGPAPYGARRRAASTLGDNLGEARLLLLLGM